MTDIDPLDNPNDQQILHRLDGPFATREMIEEVAQRNLAMLRPTHSSSINEPTPLTPVPSPYLPERFEAAPAPEQTPPDKEPKS